MASPNNGLPVVYAACVADTLQQNAKIREIIGTRLCELYALIRKEEHGTHCKLVRRVHVLGHTQGEAANDSVFELIGELSKSPLGAWAGVEDICDAIWLLITEYNKNAASVQTYIEKTRRMV